MIQSKLKPAIAEGFNKQIKIASLKNYLLALKSDGELTIYDMTNIDVFFSNPVGYNIKLPRAHFVLNMEYVPEIKIMKSFNGDLLLLSFVNNIGKSIAVMYECLTPAIVEYDGGEGWNFRFPMFFIVFIIILLLQFTSKKNGKNNDIISILLGF